MTENLNSEENSEVIQTKKMNSSIPQQPEVFELKCQNCGVVGELEEYMDEFDCPQCGGKMYPIHKKEKETTETTKLSCEEQEKMEQETATISISKAQINEYKKNIKVAKPVDIGIFASGAPAISQGKGMSTSSKSLGIAAPATPLRTAQQSNTGLPPVTRSITTGLKSEPPTNTATRILPDPILEKELESLRQRQEQEELARKNKGIEVDTTKTRVEIDLQEQPDISILQKLEIERLRAEGLEKLIHEEALASEQEREKLRQEQEAVQKEREELERRRIELQELERKFQAASQTVQDTPLPSFEDEEQEEFQQQAAQEQQSPVAIPIDNKKLIIIIVAAVAFMLIFGIVIFMLGKSSVPKTSDAGHIIIQNIADVQWRGRQMPL